VRRTLTVQHSTAKWFKIDQIGNKSDGGYNLKYQQDVVYPWPLTVYHQLDTDLARNEIIALHVVVTPGGVDFYPPCTQIRVGGSPTGPSTNCPLSRHGNDPGIYDPSIYTLGAAARVETRFAHGLGHDMHDMPAVNKLIVAVRGRNSRSSTAKKGRANSKNGYGE